MSGLFSSLITGLRSLSNTQSALSVVGDNIANVNTPGYTRKRITFTPTPPQVHSFGLTGTGAEVESIDSIRDRFIERRLLNELQIRGQLEGQEFATGQIELILFASEGSGVADQLSRFFNSFSELAADPSSISKRGVVIGEGEKLASTISATFSQLEEMRVDNRLQIRDSIDNINSFLEQIAPLNSQIRVLEHRGLDAGVLGDKRQHLMNQLAEEIGLESYQSESGELTITTNSGRLLLVGDKVFQPQVTDTSSQTTVTLSGEDITAELTTGKLGGFLRTDNQTLPGHLAALDTLAQELATEVNAVHSTGEGLDNTTGLNFFSFSAPDPAGSLSVAITDEKSVAAGQVGSGPGDGTVAQQITDLRDKSLTNLGDQTFVNYFSQQVAKAGLESRQISLSLAAQKIIVGEVENQRNSVSGVALDEEAVHLIQLERAYQASSRFILAVDELLEETMNLIR